MLSEPLMTSHPPTPRTSDSPIWGRFWTHGVKCPRMSASLMYAHSTFLAASASLRSSASSWAKDFTTRTPLTFSSTTVATPASRAWITQEIGNIMLPHPHADAVQQGHHRQRDERRAAGCSTA